MSVNVGTVDRLLRLIVGLVLLYLVFLSGMPLFAAGAAKWIALVVGVVMLVTAAVRICPLYSLLGIKTCKV